MAVLLTLMLFRSLCCETLHSLGHTVSPEYGTESPLFVPTNEHKLF